MPENSAESAPPRTLARALRARAPFVVVPLLLVLLAAALVASQGRYESRHFDPEYIYLLNALNLLVFQPPFHNDHPGTTLQLLGAACLLVRWLAETAAGGEASVQLSVLADPESYLRTLQLVLSMVVAVAVYAAGRAAALSAQAVRTGIALQVGALLFVTPLKSLSRVSAEPLLFALVFALVIPLLPSVFAGENERSPGALASGALFGLGMVSKVTFLPLASAAVFLPGRRARARFAIAAVVAMAAATVPIWSRLHRTADWLFSLLTHSGVYGEGALGPPGARELSANLEQVLAAEPLLAAWFLFYLAAWLTLRFGSRGAPDASSRATARALGFGAGVLALQAILAVKHYAGSRYLLPALAATALPNAALFHFLGQRSLRDGARRGLAVGGGLLVAASLVVTAGGLVEIVETDRSYRADEIALAQVRQALGDCTTIGYYRSSAGDYALHFGHGYTRPVHGAALERLHPGSLAFERLGSNRFVGFGKGRRDETVIEMVRQGRCVLLQGSILGEGEAEIRMPRGLSMRELFRTRYQTLSRLEPAEPSRERGSEPRSRRRRRNSTPP